jgi:hypothetical protein
MQLTLTPHHAVIKEYEVRQKISQLPGKVSAAAAH